MDKNDINKLLAIPLALGMINGEYQDYYMFGNEKLMSYSVSLLIEVDELLESGYTKDEIITMIKESDFCEKDPNLTKEESEYLKSYSIRMLDVRYRLYMEKNSIKKLYKNDKSL